MDDYKIAIISHEGYITQYKLYTCIRNVDHVVEIILEQGAKAVLVENKPPMIQEEPHG